MKRAERSMTWFVDSLTINAAYTVYFHLRVETGWINVIIEPEYLLPMGALWAYWSVVFFFFGLYRSWYDQSRLDEVFSVVRSVTLGVLVLFFLIVLDDLSTDAQSTSRMLIVGYWALLTGSVVAGRLLLRYIQRRLVLAGIGVRKTVIVGWSKRSFELCDMVTRAPSLGYRVQGFIASERQGKQSRTVKTRDYHGLPVLGDLETLENVIKSEGIQEVLVGLDSKQHDQLLHVLKACNGREVGVKILADMYDIVTGQARVHSIFGVPLLDIQPQIMQPWEEASKRLLDTSVSLLILVAGLPVWSLIAICIRLDSFGPILYKQERVGLQGRVFQMVKFRSMFVDAEKTSGPVWAGRNDPRVTRVGRLLRRIHLDEVPQFWNVLVGDMSLVGPRPERPHFVEALSKEIPLYRRRLKVRPGITGWAQVKHKYDESIDDVKEKVKYDLFYIENASWRFDLKILLNTLYVMLMRKGHS